LGGSVTVGIRARLYTRNLNTPLITCFWNKTCKIKVFAKKCVRNAKDYLVREALEVFFGYFQVASNLWLISLTSSTLLSVKTYFFAQPY
jgi:hypothetical protein